MAAPRSKDSIAQMPEASRVFSTYTNPLETQSTVIIGAGIIGCATAYYLSHSGNTKPDTIHLVEASPELFASASGKAGGFVAEDWFGPATASLGSLSFRLHRELAEQYDGRKNWGYSRSTATSLMEGSQTKSFRDEDWLASGGSRAPDSKSFISDGDEAPEWLTRRSGDRSERVSEVGGVAQVDPLRLSQFLLRESVMKGVRLHHPAKAVRISKDDSGDMSGIRIQHEHGTDHKIPCTRLLITAGAWTPRVFSTLFPASSIKLGVQQLAGHSLVVRSPRWRQEMEEKGCHAVFTSMRSGLSPELFSRSGEEIYIAGLNDASLPLPDLPTDAQVDDASIDELTKISERLLGTSASASELEIIKSSLCFRPVTRTGVPILSRIQEKDLGGIETKAGADGGVFVAAGHGPWGISQSLGTGKVMAEMLEGGVRSADVGELGLQ